MTPEEQKNGLAMNHAEFKQHRKALGLSVNQMALVLGCSPVHVRRMELDPSVDSARQVNPQAERLVLAYLEGYRPKDWPL